MQASVCLTVTQDKPRMKGPFAVIKTATYAPGVVCLLGLSSSCHSQCLKQALDQFQVLKEWQVLVCLVYLRVLV